MTLTPTSLPKPITKDGKSIAQIILDITIYLPPASVAQLEYLIEWYKRICPPDRWVRYAIPETQGWDLVRQPNLTKHGQAAAVAGEPMPFLAPVRRRIEAGRPFHVLFWDGREIDTYCFSLRQIRAEHRELHTFVRITIPTSVDPVLLLEAARDILDHIDLISGHGGLCFGYDPRKKFDAFTAIYPLARRYWGIDVEDLNGTLPLMKRAIKSPNWLTVLGSTFAEADGVKAASLVPMTHPLIQVERRTRGMLFRVGTSPDAGDHHRPGPELDALIALGTALAPLVVRDHPSFSGEGFIDHDNTDGWLHRFDDPAGWS